MFRVVPTNVDTSVLESLWTHYNRLDSHFRTIMGINNNNNQDKKERLIVDEVNANNEATDIQLQLRLMQRQKFCKICNEYFGTNISVKIRKPEVRDDSGKTTDVAGDNIE